MLSGYDTVAILAMTRAVARAATTGDADLALVRSSGPGRRLLDVGKLIEVLSLFC